MEKLILSFIAFSLRQRILKQTYTNRILKTFTISILQREKSHFPQHKLFERNDECFILLEDVAMRRLWGNCPFSHFSSYESRKLYCTRRLIWTPEHRNRLLLFVELNNGWLNKWPIRFHYCYTFSGNTSTVHTHLTEN